MVTIWNVTPKKAKGTTDTPPKGHHIVMKMQ